MHACMHANVGRIMFSILCGRREAASPFFVCHRPGSDRFTYTLFCFTDWLHALKNFEFLREHKKARLFVCVLLFVLM
jgi:hypothetical protein